MADTLEPSVAANLTPIGQLGPGALRALCERATVRTYPAGHTLFEKGSSDHITYFLLAGSLELKGHKDTVTLEASSADAKQPLSNSQPRQHTVSAVEEVQVTEIDNNLLNNCLLLSGLQTHSKVQAEGYEVHEIEVEQDLELGWVEELLDSPGFSDLPLVNLVHLFSSFESHPVKSGDVVIQQDDKNLDYYYIIRQGSCRVTRSRGGGNEDLVLANLKPGSTFGEDALISESARSATVTATSDGMLMRLSRKDFDMILVGQRVRWVDFSEVKQRVADGAQLLDTRFESEFKSGTLRGALNIPFYVLRLRMSQLNADQPYILFCNDARQSAAAAFLMRQEGLDVSVIRDGIQGRQNQA